MLTQIQPPTPFESQINGRFTVFLAGSIEMDRADNWQKRVAEELVEHPIVLLNPRRENWDSGWHQSIENEQFRQQVEWELDGLERADMIVVYFDPATKSPISLLELGLFAHSQKAVVCCPARFWRKGNVDIVCARYNIPMVDSLDDLINAIRATAEEWGM